MSSIFEESPGERASRYLELADRARRRAERIDEPELRHSYLQMSQAWEKLAIQAERESHQVLALPHRPELRIV